MEYGLIFYQKSPNLGDDIQSYAASRFLPHIDYIIERENLDGFHTKSGKPVATILAGWFLYNHLNWPPSPYILPHVTSFHLDTFYSNVLGETALRNFVIHGYGAEWLIQNGPIGCRDEFTRDLLTKNNISSYFSGCLTLTLSKFDDVEYHGKICAVDVAQSALERIKKYAQVPVYELSHYIELEAFDFERRMKYVEQRLRLYQGASLVITGRLHVALPCLALGTPVLLLREEWAANRIDTYLPYVNHMELSDFVSGKQNFNLNSPPPNPNAHIALQKQLTQDCNVFIARCETMCDTPTYDSTLYQDCIKRMDRLKKLMSLRVDKYMRLADSGQSNHVDP